MKIEIGQLRRLVENISCMEALSIEEGVDLVEDLQFDNYDYLLIQAELKASYGVEVNYKDLEDCSTCEAILELINGTKTTN